jgi:uncharacterized membrane protein YeiH
LPVYWIEAPQYLAVALLGGVLGYYGSELVRGEEGARRRALIWADGGGLAVFCVIGAQAGLDSRGALVHRPGHRRDERRLWRLVARHHRQ